MTVARLQLLATTQQPLMDSSLDNVSRQKLLDRQKDLNKLVSKLENFTNSKFFHQTFAKDLWMDLEIILRGIKQHGMNSILD